MRKDGKYRFSLQFPAATAENIRVGEFLEQLGNQKSKIVVMALLEFLSAHPGLLEPNTNITIKQQTSLDSDSLKGLIRELITEQLALRPDASGGKPLRQEELQTLEQDVSEMLGNLDMFL